jgi:hypothetical protein
VVRNAVDTEDDDDCILTTTTTEQCWEESVGHSRAVLHIASQLRQLVS